MSTRWRQGLAVLMGVVILAGYVGAGVVAPDSKLTANSVWKGTISEDPRKARGESRPATLCFSTRDGEKVAGLFRVGAGRRARAMHVEGTVDAKGKLKLRPVRIEAGDWGNQAMDKVYIGKVNGESLAFRIVDADNPDPDAQGASVELSLDEDTKP